MAQSIDFQLDPTKSFVLVPVCPRRFRPEIRCTDLYERTSTDTSVTKLRHGLLFEALCPVNLITALRLLNVSLTDQIDLQLSESLGRPLGDPGSGCEANCAQSPSEQQVSG